MRASLANALTILFLASAHLIPPTLAAPTGSLSDRLHRHAPLSTQSRLRRALPGVDESTIVFIDSLKSLGQKLHPGAVEEDAKVAASLLDHARGVPRPPPPPPKGWSLRKAERAKVTAGGVMGATADAQAANLAKTAASPAGEGVAGGGTVDATAKATTAATSKLRDISGTVKERLLVTGLVTGIGGAVGYGGEKLFDHEEGKQNGPKGRAAAPRQRTSSGREGYAAEQASRDHDRTFCKTSDGLSCTTPPSAAPPPPVAPLAELEEELEDGDALTGEQKRSMRALLETPNTNAAYVTSSDRKRLLRLLKLYVSTYHSSFGLETL